jgi:AraC-like DNA-binding protein
LGLLLISLESIREFLYVFGTLMKIRTPIEKYLQFYLFVPAVVAMAMVGLKTGKKSVNLYLILPGLSGFVFIFVLIQGWVSINSWLNAYLPVIIDFVVLFWFYFLYTKYNSVVKAKTSLLRLIQLFFCFFLVNGLRSALATLSYMDLISLDNYSTFVTYAFPIIGSAIVCMATFWILSRNSTWVKSKKASKNHIVLKSKDMEIVEDIIQSKVYLDAELTLSKLSIRYERETKEVSNAIFTVTNKNFKQFINDLRIDYFLSQMKAGESELKTVFGIAQDAGFKSKATFNRVFKKRYGRTPTEYLKEMGV